MAKLCVGIDVSKDKFDVSYTIDGTNTYNVPCPARLALRQAGTGTPHQLTHFEYSTFLNEKKGFKKFLKQSETLLQKMNLQNIHFCMESTGIYYESLCEYLQDSNHIVSAVNPSIPKSFALSIMLRTKNDKVDSSMLARFCFKHNPNPTPKLPESFKHFRYLVRHIDTLRKDRTREIARFKSSSNSDVRQFIHENIQLIEKQQSVLIAKIKKMVKEDDFLRTQIELLKTVPCVGDKTAWVILSELNCLDIENLSPQAIVAHAGLSPKEHSSGSSVHGRSPISRIGNSNIRKALFFPALGCIRHPNYFTKFYLHLIERGKPKKVAVTAVMRKILLTSIGVLKNQTPFDPNWAEKAREKYNAELDAA